MRVPVKGAYWSGYAEIRDGQVISGWTDEGEWPYPDMPLPETTLEDLRARLTDLGRRLKERGR